MTNKPGLRLKSGVFSEGKTVNSVRDSANFNEYKQINIFNQPTGYTHILIKTPNDLVSVLRDIYYYHLYYNSYNEKIEQLELYKQTLKNYNNKTETSRQAYNLPKLTSKWKKLKQWFLINIGKIQICNTMPEQLIKEINNIEKVYIPARQKFIDKYGDDLILDYFNFISLDEAQIYFGARSWEKNFSGKNEFLREFIAYPVKLNTRLEPIVQNPNMLDINFRRQASTYVLHETFLFGFIQKTSILDVKDPEKVSFETAEVTSKSYRPNLYKIFGLPKLQYYRKHLIKPTDPDLYQVGDYFKHIRRMTDSYNLQNQKNVNKNNKIHTTKINEKNSKSKML